VAPCDSGFRGYARRMHLAKTSIVLASFLVGCAASVVASQLVIPSARAGTNPQRWEYFCMYAVPQAGGRTKSDVEAFNRAGAEGWELAVVATETTWCFKRQLP